MDQQTRHQTLNENLGEGCKNDKIKKQFFKLVVVSKTACVIDCESFAGWDFSPWGSGLQEFDGLT